MNVSCPTCTTIFRIDPAKVPFGGIRARCSECGGAIDVPDTDASQGVTLTPEHVAAFQQQSDWAVDPFATPHSSSALRRSSIEAMVDSDSAAAPEPEFEDDGPFAEPEPVVPTLPAPRNSAPYTPRRTSAVTEPMLPVVTPTEAPKFTPRRTTAVTQPMVPVVPEPAEPPARPVVPTPPRPAAPPLPPIARPGAMRPAVPTPRAGAPVVPAPRIAAPAVPTRPLGNPVVAPPVRSASPATQPSIPAVPNTPSKPTPGSGRVVNPFLTNDPSTKAKRLARALVSDMIAYLPAKREEGLRDGTLKQLFREEIKKSYEEYVDQVGATMAETTTYFQDALNEILAGGKTIF